MKLHVLVRPRWLLTLRSLAVNRVPSTKATPVRGVATQASAAAGPDVVAASRRRDPLVLGIESSCDDTGVAVVTSSGRVLGESLATQADIHAAWGGVVPKLAQEAHEAAIDSCVEAALQAAGVTPDQLDAVAVTIGPGLSLCLRVGVLKARQLSAVHRLPLIPVHHMEAHALVARLGATDFAADAAAADAGSLGGAALAGTSSRSSSNSDSSTMQELAAAGGEAAAASGAGQTAVGERVDFPFLCLLISGGHNLLLLVEGVGRYTQLGTTLDDALGEAYDKVARLLGLDLRPSGGAALEAFAREGDPRALPLSVPMQRRPTCDFSYAGLKTAVRLAIEELAPEPTDANRQQRADIAASFQRVAVQHLEERVRRAAGWALESHPEVRHLVVAGGVASNQYVRARLAAAARDAGLSLVCPPPRLCTDNGVMVAWAGVERLQLGLVEPPPAAEQVGDGWVDLRPRWPLTDRKDPRSFTAPRSARKKRIFTSLTRLMEQQQGQQQEQQQLGEELEGCSQQEQKHHEEPPLAPQRQDQQQGQQQAVAAEAA